MNDLDKAPCYWLVADDGALWKCHDCNERKKASDVIACLTPNGMKFIVCYDCIDKDWLDSATKMKGKV